LMPKGDYSASTTYAMLDIVNHSGASWVCKQACTGQTPSDSNTAYWQRLGTAVDLSKYLPKSGGVVSAESYIPMVLENKVGDTVYLQFVGMDWNVLGYLGFDGADGLKFLNHSGGTSYNLLHTGNKPTGTYTGNGSATERIIDVGNSISTLYAVFSTKGIVFVTGLGFYDTNGNRHENMSVYQGKLHITTINDYVNANGETYYYVGL